MDTKRTVRLSFWLGMMSLVSVGVSFLALTDISHGAGGPPEWRALQVSLVIVVAFHVCALLALWRVIRADTA